MSNHRSPFPFFKVGGTPKERGVSYGTQAKSLIELSVRTYLAAFNLRDEAALHERVAPVRERIGRYFPKLLEELDGIALGAGCNSDHIVALNSRTELLLGKKAEDGCTSMAFTPQVTGGKTLIGQNWDWIPKAADLAIVLQIESDFGPDIITFVEAGMLARSGMNSAGLGLCGNYIQSESDFKHAGIPVPVIRRAILEQPTLSQAIDVVERTPRAMSSNHLLAHRDGLAVDLEVTPAEVFRIEPVEGRLVHANHIQSNRPNGHDLSLQRFPDSRAREARVRELISTSETLAQENMIAVLRDKQGFPYSICRSTSEVKGQGDIETVAAVVMDLDVGILNIARGPAIDEFQQFTFRH